MRHFGPEDGPPESHVWSILQTTEGEIWVSTSDGLAHWDGSRFRLYGPEHGLATVGALAEDHDGNLWGATPGSGAVRIAHSGFTSYHAADGLALDRTYSIFANRAGRTCTVSGSLSSLFLNCFDGRRFVSVHPNTPAAIQYFGWGVNQLTFQDHLGEWWVATGEGLCRVSKADRLEELARSRPRAIYTKADGLAGNDISASTRIHEATSGSAPSSPEAGWSVGSVRAAGSTAMQDRAGATGPPRPVRKDGRGNLWLSFYGGGLARYREGKFRFFTVAEGAPAGSSGLGRVDDPAAEQPHFSIYTAADGLASNHMVTVVDDRWGRIYAGSDRGLDRFNIDETAGLRVSGAVGGMEEAIAGTARDVPDVALADIGLPGMSGIAGIRELKKRCPRLLPLILTVYEDDDRIFQALCAGACGYLLKKTPPSRLLESLREAVAGGAPMSPEVARRVVGLFQKVRPPANSEYHLTPHELRILRLLVAGENLQDDRADIGGERHDDRVPHAAYL